MLAKGGIEYLKNTPMILTMILFMSGINLVASAFDAVLPGTLALVSWTDNWMDFGSGDECEL